MNSLELKDKKIVLGITGGIAAYKSVYLLRLLKQSGADVKVVMTPSVKEFVGALTFSVLSQNPVYADFTNGSEWNSHVELAKWADFLVVAPVTANTVAKFAHGLCDNLLCAVYLSIDPQKVILAPAMDLDMYNHPTTEENIEKLKSFGNVIIHADSGELASGLVGPGRMKEPEEILKVINTQIKLNTKLKNKKILITAGPTRESLDSVRYLTNASSGKMGFRLAEVLSYYGANVTLITGPSSETLNRNDIERIDVKTGQEMFEVVKKRHDYSDFCIFAAAVSDYKSKSISSEKIKKSEENIILELEKNIDIAEHFGKLKKENQIHIGFALETENEELNAKEKLKKKNLDAIILNSLKDEGAGFEFDTNKITIFDNSLLKAHSSELKSKLEISKDIAEYILKLLNE